VIAWRFVDTPLLIAGPCVVEDDRTMMLIAERLAAIAHRHRIPVCFKASFDKANRARGDSPRGPGMSAGLDALVRVREATGLPVLTDIHESSQVADVAAVVDVLQIPAFLSRQTDLLVAAGRSGKPVNIKKGQWMQAEAMRGAVDKVRAGGSSEIAVTERGTFFGYGDLVVDYRNFALMREATGAPALYDATHSVQQPGRAAGGASGGQREHIPALLAAAAAAGADGFFIETHPDPAHALSDAATQWPLAELDGLIDRTLDIWRAAAGRTGV
jgi:2-dehydro-3-deoxyphosphooctonate aldolase (KDO 8-P synthase)